MKVKNIFKWLGIALFSLIFLAAFIPTLISSNWGKTKVQELINRSIAGHISFKNIDINFFGPQQIDNALLNDPDNQFVLSIESIKVDHSLFSLIFEKISPGNMQIHNLNLNLVEGEKGDSNVRRALRPNTTLFTSIGSPIYFHAERIDLSLADDFFGIMANGTSYQNELEGLFTIDTALTGLNEETIKQLAESPELLMQPNTHFHVDATIKNMPVALIDLVLAMKDPNLRGLAEQAIGPQINLDVRNAKSDYALSLEVDASSANVNAHFIIDLSQERIAITKPGTLRLGIAPSLLHHFLDPKLDMQLGGPTNLLFAIEQFDLPIDTKSRAYDFARAILKGRIDLQEALITSKSNFSDILLDHLSATFDTAQTDSQLALKITGQASQNSDPVQIAFETWIDKATRLNFRMPPPIKINLKHIPLALADELLGLGNLLETQIGKYANLSVDTILQKDAIDLAISFSSEKVRIPALLLHINENLSLMEPLKMEYELAAQDSHQVRLPSQVVKVQLDLDPVHNISEIKNITDLNLSGKVLVDDLIVSTDHLKEEIHLHAIQVPWEIAARDNSMTIKLDSSIYLDRLPAGKISNETTVANWLTQEKVDFSKAFVSTKLDLNQVPNKLVAVLSLQEAVAQLIGESLDYSLEANLSLNNLQGNVSMNLVGDGLQGTGRFKVQFPAIGIAPITLDLEITPERFKAIRHLINKDANDHLTLADNAHVKLHVTGITEGTQIGLTAKAQTDQLIVLDTISGTSLTFKNIEADIQSIDLYEKLDFNITARQTSAGQTSDFVTKGVIENAFLPDGTFNKNRLTLLADVKIADLPLHLFCDTFCVTKSIAQKIEALFGPTLNVDIHTALKDAQGPVIASLTGPNGDVHLDARIDKGTLYLNHPFQAKFTATKALGNSILQDIFPLLSGTVSADQPFTISLDDKGFAFPLLNFDVKLIQIAKGTLSLGNVKFTKEGQLGEILTLLTPPDADLILVWFTPLYFSMNQGELNLARIDMLISNHFPVAAWGTLNFPKDKIQLMIGLSGDAISYAFNVNVDSAYMLQLPLKGKIASASLDKRNATTKIGALVAHSQKSTQGTILGTVLDLASGGLTEEKPPRPTTSPFPWERQTQADREKRLKETRPSVHEEKKKDSKEKMFEKAANSLLDGLFK